MKEKKDALHYLKEEAENLAIPNSITPEEMKRRLEQIEVQFIAFCYRSQTLKLVCS